MVQFAKVQKKNQFTSDSAKKLNLFLDSVFYCRISFGQVPLNVWRFFKILLLNKKLRASPNASVN